MARKNRVSVANGLYHVTSRIVGGMMMLKNPKIRDYIVERIYSVAAFSGVEVRAWCIMENHFHLLVQVPEVPRGYWLDPDESPDTASFTQRPPETTAPRWRPADIPFEGDCPRRRSRSRFRMRR